MDEGNEVGIESPIEDRRPVPVRAAMEGSEPEGGPEDLLQRRFLDPKSRQEWVAWISGRSTSGVLPLRVIPLLEISFRKASEPEVPMLRGIYPGQSLDDLDDAALLLLFRSARPFESRSPKKDGPPKKERGEPSRRDPRR